MQHHPFLLSRPLFITLRKAGVWLERLLSSLLPQKEWEGTPNIDSCISIGYKSNRIPCFVFAPRHKPSCKLPGSRCALCLFVRQVQSYILGTGYSFVFI